MKLVAVDIGGTHARFCIAGVDGNGTILLGPPITLKTSDYPSLPAAWEAFAAQAGANLPSAAAIAIAGPVTGETVRMSNNSWVVHTDMLDEQLGVERALVLNDFAAVGHAVAQAGPDQFQHLFGPQEKPSRTGVTTIVGPGTGLGVGLVLRTPDGYHVLPTEGGHVDFSPVDAIEDAILARLRQEITCVQVEDVVSGPGIVPIYRTVCALEGVEPGLTDDFSIWNAALTSDDTLANAALDRFAMAFGSAAGDFALAHGASGVVLAGGMGLRLRDRLAGSSFHTRFCYKGSYERLMASIPIKLITMPEPGLYGAAAAFLQRFGPERFGDVQ